MALTFTQSIDKITAEIEQQELKFSAATTDIDKKFDAQKLEHLKKHKANLETYEQHRKGVNRNLAVITAVLLANTLAYFFI